MLKGNDFKTALDTYVKTKEDEVKNQIIEYLTNANMEELKKVLFDALVPNTGKADLIAGEIIRAVNNIGYRYFNDGDVYFSGYGIETAGSAAIYLSKLNKAFETLITRLYPEQYLITSDQDGSYKNFVLMLETRAIKIIQNKPELILKRNTINSATKFDKEAEEVFNTYDQILNDGDYEDEEEF